MESFFFIQMVLFHAENNHYNEIIFIHKKKSAWKSILKQVKLKMGWIYLHTTHTGGQTYIH